MRLLIALFILSFGGRTYAESIQTLTFHHRIGLYEAMRMPQKPVTREFVVSLLQLANSPGGSRMIAEEPELLFFRNLDKDSLFHSRFLGAVDWPQDFDKKLAQAIESEDVNAQQIAADQILAVYRVQKLSHSLQNAVDSFSDAMIAEYEGRSKSIFALERALVATEPFLKVSPRANALRDTMIRDGQTYDSDGAMRSPVYAPLSKHAHRLIDLKKEFTAIRSQDELSDKIISLRLRGEKSRGIMLPHAIVGIFVNLLPAPDIMPDDQIEVLAALSILAEKTKFEPIRGLVIDEIVRNLRFLITDENTLLEAIKAVKRAALASQSSAVKEFATRQLEILAGKLSADFPLIGGAAAQGANMISASN